MDRMRRLVEAQALNDTGKPESVIAVEMRDGEVRYLRRRNVRIRHLALRPLAWIKENARLVPAEEITIVIAFAGRNLRRRTQDDEFSYRHN